MQVNDKRLEELIAKVTESGDSECPDGVECTGFTGKEKCTTCWYEYLKERIW